jgi:hypothetical protein
VALDKNERHSSWDEFGFVGCRDNTNTAPEWVIRPALFFRQWCSSENGSYQGSGFQPCHFRVDFDQHAQKAQPPMALASGSLSWPVSAPTNESPL